jgi:CDP-glucose 4,6-dehydratase
MEGMVNKNFWNGKRVFITGHTGFKGTWLSLWLKLLEAEVIGYSASIPTNPSLFELTQAATNLTHIQGDVRDLDCLKNNLQKHQPDIVIHMAAQALVRHSYKNPIETFSTNVMGTANILEATRSAKGIRGVVIVTSDKCYENKEHGIEFHEGDPMGGFDPYSSSKGCAELITSAFRNSFFNTASHSEHGVAIASVRAGNIIGGGDWAEDRLIPDIIRAFLVGNTVHIRNPHAVRPWQFVLEPLRGYLTVAEKLYEVGSGYDRAWNFGPSENSAVPVSWIVEKVAKLWDGGARWEYDNGPHPHEASLLRLDCSMAKNELGWTPLITIEQALEWTTKWYMEYKKNPATVKNITEKQINEYIELVVK